MGINYPVTLNLLVTDTTKEYENVTVNVRPAKYYVRESTESTICLFNHTDSQITLHFRRI